MTSPVDRDARQPAHHGGTADEDRRQGREYPLWRQARHQESVDRHSGPRRLGLHRSLGLRQVDLPALHQPHERHHRRLPGRRRHPHRRRRHLRPAARRGQLRARVGMVFQKPNPFPKSIFENVAYGPRIHGMSQNKTDLEEIVVSSLKKAGLFEEVKDRLNAPGTGLSGGQQQRLCIARAIAVSPEVILMDEPCSALDPIATARIEELIDELRQNYCDRHRHPFDAAGGARLAAHRLLPSRHAGRVRRHRRGVHRAAGEAHPGLHHRPLRLTGSRRLRCPTTL